MPNSSQTEIQKWEDVGCYTENTTCHVCNGTEKVKTGKIPEKTVDFLIPEVVFVGITFWHLCEECHLKGWIPPIRKFLGKFSYFKSFGDSFKVLMV